MLAFTFLLLPGAWLCLVLTGHALAARVLPAPAFRKGDRLVAAALASVGVPVALVAVLASLGAVSPPNVVHVTFAAIAAGLLAAGTTGLDASSHELCTLARHAAARPWRLATAGVAIASAGVVLAAIASYLLEPWAWDALGYHLPIVHDILASGQSRTIAGHDRYINTYPRAGELFVVWWRALSPDDRFIELSQAPFAVLGATSIAAWARRLGASRGRSVLFGAAFLSLPIVVLQLATNYVDVAFAALFLAGTYFAFGRGSWAMSIAAGAAFALYLATKPSGPGSFAFVALALALRVRTRQHALRLAALVGIAVGAGGWQYVSNFVTYGNPVWPARMALGPLVLPGTEAVTTMVEAGMPADVKALGPLARVVASWTTMFGNYVYDMRLGGFGPVFTLVLLPAALVVLARVRRLDARAWVAVVAIAPLVTPGAFWTRYTIATAGALLAAVAAGTQSLSHATRRAVDSALCLAALAGVALATPGLTNGGPSLWALARMPEGERAAHVTVDGLGREWADARARVRPGAAFGYDLSVNLVGQLWPRQPGTRAVALPPHVTSEAALEAWMGAERVDVVALSSESVLGVHAARNPARFTWLFACSLDPCSVFQVSRAPERLTAR